MYYNAVLRLVEMGYPELSIVQVLGMRPDICKPLGKFAPDPL